MSKALKIRYFAHLREQLAMHEEGLALPEGVSNIRQLRQHLQARGQPWSRVFADEQPLMVAINQQMATSDSRIAPGDEVAFFPPVTGG